MNPIYDSLVSIRNEAFGFFDQVALFGSALYTSSPNDIDIVLVYSTARLARVNIEKAKMERVLAYQFPDYTLDFTTLSKSELQQTDFLTKVPHLKVKG